MQQQQPLAAATSDSANSSDEVPVSEVKDDFFTFMSQDTSSATADNILSTYTGNTSTYPLMTFMPIHCWRTSFLNWTLHFLQVKHVSVCLVWQGVFLCQTALQWGMITSKNSFCCASLRICNTSDSYWLIDWLKLTSQTLTFTKQDCQKVGFYQRVITHS